MEAVLQSEPKYLSIFELTSLLKVAVESEFPRVSFAGEISGLKKASSGHIYLTLKDEQAQIPAVIWKGSTKINLNLEDGLAVYCVGKVTIYPAQGRLQVVIQEISPVGEGLLQKRLLELKRKLEAEGLFSPDRKRALPYLPKAVGVVTSPTGAVIRDIMVKIKERLPAIDVYLAPVRVQGKGSAEEIVAGIRLLNKSKLVDVIIVGRGGGSKEDLWAFNEEPVVRAIVASAIPIVSAVGHEVDISLSDLVSDARAPTPTAAAEMVVPKRSDLVARITELWERVIDFRRRFEPLWQDIDELELRLLQSLKHNLKTKHLGLVAFESRMHVFEPMRILRQMKERLNSYAERIGSRGENRIQKQELKLEHVMQQFKIRSNQSLERKQLNLKGLNDRLSSVNPTSVLSRGYAIVERAGKIVTEAAKLNKADEISLRFATGSVKADVKEVILKESKQ